MQSGARTRSAVRQSRRARPGGRGPPEARGRPLALRTRSAGGVAAIALAAQTHSRAFRPGRARSGAVLLRAAARARAPHRIFSPAFSIRSAPAGGEEGRWVSGVASSRAVGLRREERGSGWEEDVFRRPLFPPVPRTKSLCVWGGGEGGLRSGALAGAGGRRGASRLQTPSPTPSKKKKKDRHSWIFVPFMRGFGFARPWVCRCSDAVIWRSRSCCARRRQR